MQVDPQSIIMWGLRVRMAIATGPVEKVKVIPFHLSAHVLPLILLESVVAVFPFNKSSDLIPGAS